MFFKRKSDKTPFQNLQSELLNLLNEHFSLVFEKIQLFVQRNANFVDNIFGLILIHSMNQENISEILGHIQIHEKV